MAMLKSQKHKTLKSFQCISEQLNNKLPVSIRFLELDQFKAVDNNFIKNFFTV